MITFWITVSVSILLLVCYFIFRNRHNSMLATKRKIDKRFYEHLESNVNNIKELPLAGVTDDDNNDFEFSEAVKRIVLSDDVRVKVYE